MVCNRKFAMQTKTMPKAHTRERPSQVARRCWRVPRPKGANSSAELASNFVQRLRLDVIE